MFLKRLSTFGEEPLTNKEGARIAKIMDPDDTGAVAYDSFLKTIRPHDPTLAADISLPAGVEQLSRMKLPMPVIVTEVRAGDWKRLAVDARSAAPGWVLAECGWTLSTLCSHVLCEPCMSGAGCPSRRNHARKAP